MNRREFLGTSTIAAGGALPGNLQTRPAEPPMVGIQAGAVSFADESFSPFYARSKTMRTSRGIQIF